MVEADATDIGGTLGTIEANLEANDVGLKMDQLGTSDADKVRVGFMANFVIPFAEITFDAWALALPGDTVVTDTTKKRISINGNIGQQALRDSLTAKYVIKPMEAGVATTDANEWLTLPKGYAMANTSLSFTVDGQRVIPTTVEGLPDSSNSNVRVILGDETAT